MRLVFDIETNPIDFSIGNHVEQAHTVWCIVAHDIDTGEVFEYYAPQEKVHNRHRFFRHNHRSVATVDEILGEADELIGHNIIQFDLPVLYNLFKFRPNGRIVDTLVTSRLLYPDRNGGHSLDAWGQRLGVEKSGVSSFEKFSEELLRYCRQDVVVNAELYKRLQQEVGDHDWSRALDLEHRIAGIIAEQEAVGFKFNQEQARSYVHEWTNRITDIDGSLCPSSRPVSAGVVNRPFKINGNPSQMARKVCDNIGLDIDSINGPFCGVVYQSLDLNSKQQQKEFLLENGWKPQQFTPTGQPKLDDSILKVEGIGAQLHERNILSHRLGQVQGLLELSLSDGRVHGGANPCGTPTGRMRHSRIVNIPRVSSPYGEELRSLFTVPEGKVLVGYDAASLELRILAHYIGDEAYSRSVTSTDKTRDAHTLAAQAAGESNRDTGKTINYALIYGAGDYKLGTIVGGGRAEGAKIRKALYATIPGLESLIRKVESASKKGFLIGLDGRKLLLRDKKSALNTLIQGGGAVFMKTVTEILDRSAKRNRVNGFKVVDMHDEAQWELADDPKHIEYFESLVHSAFHEAGELLNLRCPQQAEVKVGRTWADTH